MPLTLRTDAPNFPFHVIGKDATGPGASLPVAASLVTVTADNPAGAISLDPNPTPISNPFDAASGTRSIASGVVRPLAAGSATITATVVGTDGTPLVTLTDTLTVVDPAPGTAAWAGDLFGAAAPVDLSASPSTAGAHTPHTGSAAGEHEARKSHK